jgi:CAAX prenyl protease-like protein
MFGISASPRAKAYLAPFLLFTALLLIAELVAHFGEGMSAWQLSEPKYWVYPLQTVLCAILLIFWWRTYEFNWSRGWWAGILAGVVALCVWVAPQEVFGAERRLGGFDLWFFGGGDAFKWNLTFRLLRLVIVVPLVEEIFWRGFLIRHLVRDPFDSVPPDTRSWHAFAIVTFLFAVAHWGPDFVPALITGALYNGLLWWTRSLGACVIAHATTNLLLGLYLFRTQQWGFW